MMMPSFRNWRIRTKLVTGTIILVLIPLLSVASLSLDQFSNALKNSAEQDLEHLVRNVYSMCKIQQEMVQTKLISDIDVARSVLYRYGSEVDVLPQNMIRFNAVNQITNETVSVSVPSWKIGDTPITSDNQIVDEVQRLVGGTCTLFQRIKGDHFLRIATNVIKKDGSRAIGTFIPSDSPVAKALLRVESFRGRAYVVDGWYITAYEPILGKDGAVLGALYVGVKEQGDDSLNEEIKKIKVGKTGYVYIIDTTGMLRIHPAKEGTNILDAKDSSGFEYIRAMVQDAQTLPEGKIGTIRYPWANPELGETQPRQKIHKYIYFKPWDWIITAGTYEEEIYQSLYETERFILVIVLSSISMAFVLTIAVSRVLTRPIQELTKVTTKMVEGDLSQRVNVIGSDEIGVLGTSFNRMIGQIQNYTSNLENMVEKRTGELEESKEKYRDISKFLNSILDSATAYAIIALDFSGNIIEFNKGAERIFGWRKEEMIGRQNISITYLPEDVGQPLQKEITSRTIHGGAFETEMNRVKKDGALFPAYVTINSRRDASGNLTGYVEIVRDITLRKTLERELRNTKDFLENIMESSVDGIMTTDLKGKITYMNRALEDMIQHKRDEVLGTHVSNFYVNGIQTARDIMAFLNTYERAQNYELQARGNNNIIIPFACSLFLLRDEEGKLIGTAGIFKDITQKKLLEAKLKDTQAHLVEALKMRALGELVAGVAHEINNPLMASQTILHVILKNLSPASNEREKLELVRKCNDRIQRIVDHLREFSRQTKPEMIEMDINQPIENALVMTEQQLLNHNIMIEKQLCRDLPKIQGDTNQLEQVFLNLISNARDAMDDVPRKKILTISSGLQKDEEMTHIVVSIEDTGVGIPKENLEKVIEPFFSTKAVGKGTGLGLSLCFGIIEAHGGRLEIRSIIDKGTTVKIFIPVKKE
jgi:PAS domain S-box-containing protein